jgi:hypothetical protein
MLDLYVGVSAAEAELRPPCLPVPVRALVDIGASKTNIVRWVFERLGISPVGDVTIHTASTGVTPLRADLYAVEISLGGEQTGLLATDLQVVAAEDLSGSGVEALLGRDILERGLLVYDGPGRRFALAMDLANDAIA